MAKINQETAQQIIDLYVDGETYHSLAKQFGLYYTAIAKIVNGVNWKNCIRPFNIKKIAEERQNQTQFKKGRSLDLHNLS